jgi:hypothetical protein
MADASGLFQFSHPDVEQKSFPTGLVGFSPWERSTDAKFRLGDSSVGNDGSVWLYGKATAAITLAAISSPSYGLPMAAVSLPAPADCAFTAATGTIGAGATHKAFAAFAIGEHGWVKQTADLY